MREVARQLNAKVEGFKRRRPDFNGKISVFAHSLGSALCYDLMCRKVHDDQTLLEAEGMRLHFDAENLFLIGSPLGTFLNLDPTIGIGVDITKLPFRIFNVFHPNDPIATRVEPYIHEMYSGVCPVTVPCWFNMGLRESTAQWLGSLWSGNKRKSKPKSQDVMTSKVSTPHQQKKSDGGIGSMLPEAISSRLPSRSRSGNSSDNLSLSGNALDHTLASDVTDNGDANECRAPTMLQAAGEDATAPEKGENEDELGQWPQYYSEERQKAVIGEMKLNRIDYGLQLSSAMEDVAPTSWSALKAHTEYWSNRDTMLLVISSMIKATCSIPDDVDPRPPLRLGRRIIDADILSKSAQADYSSDEGEGSQTWIAGSVPMLKQSRGNTHLGLGIGQRAASADSLRSTPPLEVLTLEETVETVVDKVVEEAVAEHELMSRNPKVRVRRGGMTRSPSAGAEISGDSKTSNAANENASWSSYLPWFSGGKDKTKKPDSKGVRQ